SQGQRPVPSWVVDLIQRNTSDPSLKNDPDFIRTVAATIGQETGFSFDPTTIGDQGHSVGLFQLHDQGAGTGMSAAQRSDPEQAAAKQIPALETAYRQAAQAQ